MTLANRVSILPTLKLNQPTVRRDTERLVGWICRRFPALSRETAEDAVQDAWERLWSSPNGELHLLLRRHAYNAARRSLRRQVNWREHPSADLSWVSGSTQDPEEALANRLLEERVVRAILMTARRSGSRENSMAAALRARIFEQRGCTEIARKHNLHREEVHRACLSLRQAMSL